MYELCVCVCVGVYYSVKWEKFNFAGKLLDSECITLGKATQFLKGRNHMFSLICGPLPIIYEYVNGNFLLSAL